MEEGHAKIGPFWYCSAGVSVVVGTAISLTCMFQHLKNYRRPDLQRNIIRIFWLVPVFGIASFISLSSKYSSDYIDTIRDFYEAFAIYIFFNLLINYLGGERSLLLNLEHSLRAVHVWPLNLFLEPVDMSDPRTFLYIRRGILQYVIIKPILGVLTMILKVSGRFSDGYISWSSCYLWFSIVYNISICTAMYCLVMFYMQSSSSLKPYRPIPKFLCIKAIIFFSYWQGFLIAILVASGFITSKDGYSANNIAVALQDLLICLEMPPFAIAHWYAFSWKDYDSSRLSSRILIRHAFRDAVGFKDVAQDFYHTIKGLEREYEDNETSFVLAGQQRFYKGKTYGTLPSSNETLEQVEFDDIDPEDEIEREYVYGRSLLYGDCNYPVLHEDPWFREPPTVQQTIRDIASSFNFGRKEGDLESRSDERMPSFKKRDLQSSSSR